MKTPSIYSDEFWRDTVAENNDAPKISPFELQANQFINNATAMLVNGVRSSIPQAPIANLLVKMCSSFGVAVGNVLSIGVLADILPIRKACMDAFTEGVRSVKIEAPKLPAKLDS